MLQKMSSAAARVSLRHIPAVQAALFTPVTAAAGFSVPLPATLLKQPSSLLELALSPASVPQPLAMAPAITLDGPLATEVDSLELMNRNKRKLKKANHGARPCNSRGRKARRIRRHWYGE
mgnify:CR=1 FL=1